MQRTPLIGRAVWGRLFRNRSFVIGAVLVLVMVAVALSADWLTPFDPLKSNVRARLAEPVRRNLLALVGGLVHV